MKSLLFIALSLSVASYAETEPVVDCDNAYTTRDMNHCAALELEAAEQTLTQYLTTSLEHNADDPELVEAIKLAQHDWLQYRQSHCDSILTQWRDGTIRGVMTISCKTALTQQRTYTLWANFLTYMDSAEPVLPEPKF